MSKEKNFIQVTYSSTILYISIDGLRYLCIGAELRKVKDKITENRKISSPGIGGEGRLDAWAGDSH